MTQKEKIYIVEDDELLSLVLSQGFKKEGYEVTVDMGMKGVAKRIEETRPDLILLDVTLPHESGLDILGDVRGKGIPCPVIMLTADDSAETAVNALKHGAYDYIT
jgi:DNA-binding response OmpR family regulator